MELELVVAVENLPFEFAKRQLDWIQPTGSLHLEGGMSTMNAKWGAHLQQSFLDFAASFAAVLYNDGHTYGSGLVQWEVKLS